MGQEDIQESDYFEDNHRFADLCNGTMYRGRTVIKPDELQESDSVITHATKNQGIKRIRDKVKRWRGIQIAVLVLENQEYVDYRMVFRNMLTEAMEYNKQWKRRQKEHKEKEDLTDRHEYLSGMKREDIYEPVIIIVLYLGTDRAWDGPRTLYQLIGLDQEENELRAFITNYKLNLFDYHEFENFEMFRSELRAVFEYLSSAKDKAKMAECMWRNRKLYSNLDEDTVNLLSTLTHTKDIKRYRIRKSKNRRGGFNVCKAFEDMKLEGRTEGIIEGRTEGENIKLISMIRKKYAKGLTTEECADMLEENVEIIKDIYTLLEKNSTGNDVDILKAWQENEKVMV